MDEKAYFLTVDWYNKGERGIFCDRKGRAFRKDTPHTHDEMCDILGVFGWLTLSPKSELFTKDEVAEYSMFYPLREYSNKFGIAKKPTKENENV